MAKKSLWDVRDEWWGRIARFKVGFNHAVVVDGGDDFVNWTVSCMGEPRHRGMAHSFEDGMAQVEALIGYPA